MPRSRTADYYSDCTPHQPGTCRGCGGALGGRRRYYCADDACRDAYEADHFWGTARGAAIRRAGVYRLDGHLLGAACAGCGRILDGSYDHQRRTYVTNRPEVNHIAPVDGRRDNFSCANHQANLEVLCHECHLQVTAQQRAMGQIGAGAAPLRLIVACPWPRSDKRPASGWRYTTAIVLSCGHVWHVHWEVVLQQGRRMRCRACAP